MFNYKFRKMKKTVTLFFILGMLFLGSLSTVNAQDEKAERKDTISADNSDPVFYDAEEDTDSKSGSTGIILAVAGGVVVLGAVVFFLKKKKK